MQTTPDKDTGLVDGTDVLPERPPVYQVPNIIPPGLVGLTSCGLMEAPRGFTKLPEPGEWERVQRELINLRPSSSYIETTED